MTLDATARESNVRDSIKKFFVDTFNTIPITFDKGLNYPDLTDRVVDRWISVNFGSMVFSTVSEIMADVHLCTRRDNEGFRLAQLRDTVMEQITDQTTTDGFKRITFYRSHPTNAWVEIGKILITWIYESAQYEADDETKVKTLSLTLKFPSII